MSEQKIEFRYTRPDVVSAQRLRFLRSSQLKAILLIWLGSMVFLSAPLVLPQWIKPGPYSSWGLVFQIALAYAVTLLVLIVITPVVDFYINRFWRLRLVLQFSQKSLRISVAGKPGGLRLKWSQIQRVDENERVFILHYGSGGKFVIVPRQAFEREGDEARFRDLLARRAVLPAEPPGEEEADESEAKES
jgi:hypothetical protein